MENNKEPSFNLNNKNFFEDQESTNKFYSSKDLVDDKKHCRQELDAYEKCINKHSETFFFCKSLKLKADKCFKIGNYKYYK